LPSDEVLSNLVIGQLSKILILCPQANILRQKIESSALKSGVKYQYEDWNRIIQALKSDDESKNS
jgi:hypothetical protein